MEVFHFFRGGGGSNEFGRIIMNSREVFHKEQLFQSHIICSTTTDYKTRAMAQTIPSEWRTNFFGVFGDSRVLCASILCPALSYYASSELFENPPAGVVESCVGGYCICFGFMIRSRLRYKYNLDGSILGDFLAHCCCQCLALARVWREAEFQVRAEKERTQWPPNTIPLPMSNPPAMTSVPLQISPQSK